MVIPGFLLDLELRCFDLPDWMCQWQDYWCDYPAYAKPFANSFTNTHAVAQSYSHSNSFSFTFAHPNSFAVTFSLPFAGTSRRDQPIYFRYHRVRIGRWISGGTDQQRNGNADY
jgi:hypothetical protein